MNYSKSMQRKNNIMHRVFISWAVIGAGALLLGGLIGYLVVKRVDTTQTTTQTETTLIYGLPGGKIFTVSEEMPEYSTSNSEFSPLDVPLGTDVQAFTFYLCKAYDIDFNFAMAVMQQESGFQADAVSLGGDYGLMQISSVNHGWLSDELGITDFLDPYSNIKAGLYILRNLFQKYETPEKVLMAYNMGETGAKVLWNQGIYETDYTRSVLQIQNNFENR